MKYIKYYESKNTLIGYRCQKNCGNLTKTEGITATEGEGWYLSKTLEFAESFSDQDTCIYKVEFIKPKKILTAGSLLSCGLLGWDYENSKIREPLTEIDDIWLRYNKMAILNSSSKKEAVIYFTELILNLGYDAVEVIEDEDEQWYVLLKENMIINYNKIK
jgi:hypothetical protein